MIQFNLLPDIKLEYIKAQRQKRMVISLSTIASFVAVGLMVILLLVVDVWQKKSMSDLNSDITNKSAQLQNNSANLNKILTVQNQLSALTQLHDQSPVTSRLAGYIGQLTPSSVTISSFNVDFAQHAINISGSAGTTQNVNTYADTLKFATVKTASADRPAFSGVVLASLAVTSKDVSYTINLTFDPAIFSATVNPTLTVPQQITTRSVVDQPSTFKAANGGQ